MRRWFDLRFWRSRVHQQVENHGGSIAPKTLPDDPKTTGEVLEYRGPLRRFRAPIVHQGDVRISGNPRITALGAGFRIAGTLTIAGCPRLERLTGPLEISSLRIRDCGLRSLPAGLHIRGALEITGCSRFEALPPGLRVDGPVTIAGCPKFSTVPLDLRVARHLRLIGRMPRLVLPEGLEVGGDLRIRRAVEQLPAGLRIGGALRISHCEHLAALPSDIKVDGDVAIESCPQLRALPEGLRMGGALMMPRSPLLALSSVTVGTSIDLSGSSALTELPEVLSVPGQLNLANCTRLSKLPRSLRVGGDVSMAGHWDFRPALNLAACESLRVWPRELRMPPGSSIEVAGSGMQGPCEVEGVRFLWRRVEIAAALAFAPIESFSAQDLTDPGNAEVRRVLLERVGPERFFELAQPEVLDEDRDPGGRRRLLKINFSSRTTAESHVFLECHCPSTGQRYLLRVPPNLRSCHFAAAWLANIEPEDYAPELET